MLGWGQAEAQGLAGMGQGRAEGLAGMGVGGGRYLSQSCLLF